MDRVENDNHDSESIIMAVKNVHWHTDEIFELQLYQEGLEFTPGDCISIYGEDGATLRPYSIASGIHESVLRLLIRKMDDSEMTTYLSNLKKGDRIRVSQPFGWLHPGIHRNEKKFVFVATGTGISPFLSYIRSHPEKPPLQCLYGVRRTEDAVGYDVLKENCPTLLAVSKHSDHDYHYGRITQLLPSLPLEEDIHYYLCGLDAMVYDVTEWLESHGISPEKIHREVFFYSSQS